MILYLASRAVEYGCYAVIFGSLFLGLWVGTP